MASSAIYNALAVPNKSAVDYANDYTRLAAGKQALAKNQFELGQAQDKAAEDAATKNAFQSAVTAAGPGADLSSVADKLVGSGDYGAATAGLKLRGTALEQKKTVAETDASTQRALVDMHKAKLAALDLHVRDLDNISNMDQMFAYARRTAEILGQPFDMVAVAQHLKKFGNDVGAATAEARQMAVPIKTAYQQQEMDARAAEGNDTRVGIAASNNATRMGIAAGNNATRMGIAAGAQNSPTPATFGDTPSPAAATVLGYRGTIPDLVRGRGPAATAQAQRLRDEVLHFDHNYDFNVSKNVISATRRFTAGPEGANLRALGNFHDHINQYVGIATALQQGDLQLANRLGNAIGIQFGQDQATNYQALARIAGPEINKALVTNSGTGQERHDLIQSLANLGSSPAQFTGAAKTYANALGVQAKHLIQQAQAAHVSNSVLATEYNAAALAAAADQYDAHHGKAAAPAAKPTSGGWSIERVK